MGILAWQVLRLIVKMTHVFWSGLVMGVADCLIQAGFNSQNMSFKRQFDPLPDTLQAGACIFTALSNAYQ